jgi:hypothetical protein
VIIQNFVRLNGNSRIRNLHIKGVQLDIDSPTANLPQYAEFLKQFRRQLPKESQVSITALLDWFRGGTAVGDVLREVDEFVPQFYDLSRQPDGRNGGSIAARIDTARWNPVFNRFGKRFRIGISSFGRAWDVPTNGSHSHVYRDLLPFDLAMNLAFQLSKAATPADEVILTYTAMRRTHIGYDDFEPGHAFQFTLPTPASVAAAVASARQFGGHCAGVVFFRWPGSDNSLAMRPDAVLASAGLSANDSLPATRVTAVDKSCAAVACVDLYLETKTPFSAQARRFFIRSSTELEYFLPDPKMPVRMAGPRQLELNLPPYGGLARMRLGRAVTLRKASFQLQEGQ